MSDSKSTSTGIGFGGLLAVAFIVLRLCKVIDWPWIWVLSPLWVPLTLILSILGIMALFIWIVKKFRKKPFIHAKKEKPLLKSKWEQRLEEIRKQHEAKR